MIWFYVAFIISLAANVGFIIYIVMMELMNKWEKKDAIRNIPSSVRNQPRAFVFKPDSQPEGEAVVKTEEPRISDAIIRGRGEG
ncbi:MAG TPA: hypothetical protein VGJ00_03865 [Rhabdochlamydiaceae bacterium]|jgi:hypothetical protein